MGSIKILWRGLTLTKDHKIVPEKLNKVNDTSTVKSKTILVEKTKKLGEDKEYVQIRLRISRSER